MTVVYQLNQVNVSYKERLILDIPELTINSGECVALLGQNGAGKSTLLNLFAFLQTADSGTISLFGNATHSTLPAALRKRIGYVNQQPYLLSGTVLDNLKLALKLQRIPVELHPQLIEHALSQTQTTQLANQAVNTLSGGELKRAAIARSIVYEPDILLLDEPFSHLDKRSAEQLESVLENFIAYPNKTVIFSTHDQLQGLTLADRTITLLAGKITETPLLNLFNGQLSAEGFYTANLCIEVTQNIENAKHIAIHPNDIILSCQAFSPTSMRNQFQGRVIMVAEGEGTVRIEIDCGERFQTIISAESHALFNIQLGDVVWLGFKASAVEVF